MRTLNKEIKAKILKAIKSGRIEERDGVFRFSERIGTIPRGTVVIDKRIVFGYPKIRRVFSLCRGAEMNLEPGKIWVEEKIDGFNLRAVLVGDEIYCISRGGFLDYFASEKLADDPKLRKFFSEHPSKVLYLEMIGNTPYTSPTKKFDIKYYIFDIGNGKNRFVGPEERIRLCKEYGLNPVPLLGVVERTSCAKLKKIAVSLDKRKGEGMVLKQHMPRKVIKYVVPASDIGDLAEGSHMLFDMPSGFMKQRVLRSAISVAELGLGKKEYDRRLGEALHKELYSVLKKGGEVSEGFEILVKNKETWDKILGHMSSEVKIIVDSQKKERGGIRIRFRKIYKKGSRKLRRAVEGYAQTD